MQTRTILVCSGLLACACASIDEDGPSALTSPEITSCQSYAISRCERMDTCRGGVLVARAYGSMAACEAHVSDACALRASAPGVHATATTIDACTAALSDASCAEFFGDELAACHPTSGSLADGEACTYALQCQSARCDRPAGFGCGVCAASPSRIPCGGSWCDAPAACVFGHCAIPIASSDFAAQPSITAPTPPREDLLMPSFTPAASVTPGSMQPLGLAACDDTRGCGPGFACVSFRVPSVSDPRLTMTRFACAPIDPASPFACARAGLARDPETGACEPAIVASAGEPCGASRPRVICGESGRCVRAPGESDGFCIAASPDGGACFVDRARGPGCMAPAFCRHGVDDATGICERPAPALCSE